MKKKYYILLGVLALFVITNPSASAFKQYMGSNTYLGLKRTTNLFVCSIYKRGGNEYFGVVGNFFEIAPPKTSTNYADAERMADSAMSADSAKMSDSSQIKMADTSTWKPPATDKKVK